MRQRERERSTGAALATSEGGWQGSREVIRQRGTSSLIRVTAPQRVLCNNTETKRAAGAARGGFRLDERTVDERKCEGEWEYPDTPPALMSFWFPVSPCIQLRADADRRNTLTSGVPPSSLNSVPTMDSACSYLPHSSCFSLFINFTRRIDAPPLSQSPEYIYLDVGFLHRHRSAAFFLVRGRGTRATNLERRGCSQLAGRASFKADSFALPPTRSSLDCGARPSISLYRRHPAQVAVVFFVLFFLPLTRVSF